MARNSMTSVRKYSVAISWEEFCWRLPIVLSFFVLHSLDATIGWGQVKNTSGKVTDRNWIEQAEPGVQLIGRPRSVRNYLDSSFTMTPNGKTLVGARGRELCIIDWDAQKLIRSIKMPFQYGSASVSKFQFSTNGSYLMVWVNWKGRPYDPSDEVDLDEFKEYRFNLDPEFPYEKFLGDRLLIYNSDYQLLHDLELTYDPERVQDPASTVPHWVADICVFDDDARAVVIGWPKTRVIDLESGKVAHEHSLARWAIPVGNRIFIAVRQKVGPATGFWWDPASDVLSEDTELNLPTHPMPILPAQKGEYFAIFDGNCNVLTIRSADQRTDIVVPEMVMWNTSGTYSTDGRYSIFLAERTLLLVDLLNQKVRFQMKLPNDHRFRRFFSDHSTTPCSCNLVHKYPNWRLMMTLKPT